MIKGSDALKVLVTGTAGFIGFHLAKLLLSQGCKVHGYDGITDYYDVNLKRIVIKFSIHTLDFRALLACSKTPSFSIKHLMNFSQMWLFIWRLKLGLGTALKIREHILNPISSALLT